MGRGGRWKVEMGEEEETGKRKKQGTGTGQERIGRKGEGEQTGKVREEGRLERGKRREETIGLNWRREEVSRKAG